MKYLLLFVFFVASLLVYKPEVYASNVFFVKKNIKMQNDQPTEHDYYLNAGLRDGLKEGMLIEVKRKVPFQDTSMLNSNEQLEIAVVELKLIHVQNNISVGRINRLLIDENTPILDYNSVMIGDNVDLGSKKWPSKKSAKAEISKKPNEKTASKASPAKKEESIELSSVRAKEEKRVEKSESSAISPDQRAQSLPVGGELSSPPSSFQ